MQALMLDSVCLREREREPPASDGHTIGVSACRYLYVGQYKVDPTDTELCHAISHKLHFLEIIPSAARKGDLPPFELYLSFLCVCTPASQHFIIHLSPALSDPTHHSFIQKYQRYEYSR
jgi:hypothetical protein